VTAVEDHGEASGGSGIDEPVLQVRDLVKHFPEGRSGLGLRASRRWVRAVDGVSSDIAPGETLGLVGESGCGKSTIAKLLLRLEDPTSGQILFQGQDVSTLKGKSLLAYRRAVQAVFQDPYSSLSPPMRVRDIIGEGLQIHADVSKRETADRVAAVPEMVGMRPEVGRLYPHEFSGGQRQRIAIAKALALDTRMLVLEAVALVDEPFHPYTEALFTAALPAHPDDHDRYGTAGQATAEVPSALDPPSGCHFHPRCPHATDVCSTRYPPTVTLGTGRQVACHLHPAS
jgi:oligopeptide/dipeptide ABC transporter ATP-binding protein